MPLVSFYTTLKHQETFEQTNQNVLVYKTKYNKPPCINLPKLETIATTNLCYTNN